MAAPSPSDPLVRVVDDDDAFRRVVEGFLRVAGYRVEGFDSGAALLAARRDEVACVILDLEMPGMDGFALQEALARVTPGAPVLFLSGKASVRDGVKAMRDGAVDFLEKPFEGTALLAAVERAVARGRGRAAALVIRDEACALLARLTPSERRVCDLVAEGLLNKQIAAVLDVSEQTVKVHRGNALRKLAVRSVPDLVRLLQRAR